MIKYTREVVTPAMAEQWLTHNTNNRRVREGKVEQYARDMKDGKWTHCVVPISFYDDDSLADGQHRLFAIMDSEMPTEFLVARGLSRADGLNIDAGLPRTLKDAGRITGLNTHMSDESLSYARAIEKGNAPDPKHPLSYAQRIELANKHDEVVRWLLTNGPHGRGLRNGTTMGAVGRAWYYETDKERLARFCEVFSTGFGNGEEESAAIAIRNYYLTHDNQVAAKNWVDAFLKCQNAVWYFMRGKKLTIIKSIKDEVYPLQELGNVTARKEAA